MPTVISDLMAGVGLKRGAAKRPKAIMTSPTSTPMAMPALADRSVMTRARARCPAPSSVATSD